MAKAERTFNKTYALPLRAHFRAAAFAAASFFMLFYVLCTPLSALALDERYIEVSAWSQCEISKAILQSTDTYEGVTEYFFDGADFYAHISYMEASMLDVGNAVELSVSVNYTDSSNYFTVTGSSCSADSKEYSVSSRFYNDSRLGQDICLIIEPKTKALGKYLSLDLSITVNNTVYELFSGLASPYAAEAENESTQSEKTTKPAQSRAAETTTSQSKSTSAAKEQTTKYKYSYSSTTANSSEKYTPGADGSSDSYEQSDLQENAETGEILTVGDEAKKVTLAPAAKVLFSIAATLAASSVFLFLKVGISSAIDKATDKRLAEANASPDESTEETETTTQTENKTD